MGQTGCLWLISTEASSNALTSFKSSPSKLCSLKWLFLLWMLRLNDAYVQPNIDSQEAFLHDSKHLGNSNDLRIFK